MARPTIGEYNDFYQMYIDYVQGDDVVEALEQSEASIKEWLQKLEEVDLHQSYAPGKWTIAQLLQHVIDTERIFAYRALCFGRGELQPLPGFEENDYAATAPAAGRKLKGLAEELLTLRKANVILFRSLQKEGAIAFKGTASNHPITINALGFIMVGHVLHHLHIIEDRYLS